MIILFLSTTLLIESIYILVYRERHRSNCNNFYCNNIWLCTKTKIYMTIIFVDYKPQCCIITRMSIGHQKPIKLGQGKGSQSTRYPEPKSTNWSQEPSWSKFHQHLVGSAITVFLVSWFCFYRRLSQFRLLDSGRTIYDISIQTFWYFLVYWNERYALGLFSAICSKNYKYLNPISEKISPHEYLNFKNVWFWHRRYVLTQH